MKRWAFVSGGVILTVVEQAAQPAIGGVWVEIAGNFGAGDLYNGSAFSKAALP